MKLKKKLLQVTVTPVNPQTLIFGIGDRKRDSPTGGGTTSLLKSGREREDLTQCPELLSSWTRTEELRTRGPKEGGQ